jgi:hypothetical protein
MYGYVQPPMVELVPYPVTEIIEVWIDGVVIPPAEYQLQDFRTLVRMRPIPSFTPTERFGWPTCLVAGTLVLTDSGMVPIEEVRVGQRVLTHRNRWRKVTGAGKTGDSETVVLTGHGGSLRCTPEHRVWGAEVRTDLKDDGMHYKFNGKHPWKLGSPGWVPAAAMVGSAWAAPSTVEPLGVVLPEGWSESDLPPDFWWMVGRWIGDGWTEGHSRPGGAQGSRRRSHGVLICCGLHEDEELGARLRSMGWAWGRQEMPRGVRFRTGNAALWSWLREQFGTGAHNKQLPAWVFGAPEGIRRELLDGYVSADGYNARPDNGRMPFTSSVTVSKALAIGTRILVAGLGYPAAIYERTSRGGFGPDGALSFRVDWPTTLPRGRRSQAWVDEEHIWTRVRRIETDERVVPVYDIEVEQDHSFVADGVVVHNSQIFDLPLTEVDTFGVTFMFGQAVPSGGIRAAKTYAREMCLAAMGQPNRLPSRITSISRQGVNAVVLDVMDFISQGRTGVPEVDMWIKSVNPYFLTRPASVWSPDIGRPQRVSR